MIVCDGVARIRHGHVHVVNNFYEGWGMYAIGGSEEPTIVSDGNVFTAPNGVNKEVSSVADFIPQVISASFSMGWSTRLMFRKLVAGY